MSSVASLSRQGGRRYRQFGSTPSQGARGPFVVGTSAAPAPVITSGSFYRPFSTTSADTFAGRTEAADAFLARTEDADAFRAVNDEEVQ